VRERGMGGYAR
jgi:pimeloyl-ACP methyl ester carboxylesterase